MRETARLLINAQTLLKSEVQMSEILKPQNFDSVVRAALMTSSTGFDDEEDLKSPSTAIRIGYELKRMLSTKWAEAIKENNEQHVKESKDFLKLMKFEWSTRVTKMATVTLQIRNFNKEKSLPEPEDIIKLQKKIRDDIKSFNTKLETHENFRKAGRMAQARLVIYNKRRSGEIDAIR